MEFFRIGNVAEVGTGSSDRKDATPDSDFPFYVRSKEVLRNVLFYEKQNGIFRMKKIDYRNQALKILPWVCANCGRDFSGKNLRELTVHHKDHNYKNNPPDGSNWELLCLYCHDHEHSRDLDAEWLPTHNSDKDKRTTASHAPFANLNKLLSDKKSNERK